MLQRRYLRGRFSKPRSISSSCCANFTANLKYFKSQGENNGVNASISLPVMYKRKIVQRFNKEMCYDT